MSTIEFSHLRHLAVFASVVECGSFAAAARQLGSSRSRVSEQVAGLEQILGVRLLQRSTRQLTVTTEGQQVYEHARELPVILRGVEAVISSPEPHGRVVLTVNHDIAHKLLLPLLLDFRAQYPRIQLDLILDDGRLDLIHEQIDLGIRIGIPKDASLVARVLHEECLVLFASPAYIKKNGKPQTVREIKRHHWISLSYRTRTGLQQFRQRGKMLEIQPDEFTLCNSPLMQQQMVIAGHGIGALFETVVNEEVARGELTRLLPSVSSEPLVFSLIYPSRRQVPLRTRVLIDFLMQANFSGSPER